LLFANEVRWQLFDRLRETPNHRDQFDAIAFDQIKILLQQEISSDQHLRKRDPQLTNKI
jgi:hypothetical protein